MPNVIGSFPCRFCGTALAHELVDLGMSPLCESFLPAERAVADGAVLPAARLRLRRSASSSSSTSTCRPRRSSPSTPTSRRTPTAGSRTPRGYAEAMIATRLGLGAAQPGRRARQQRRLPAAALRRARASPCSASSRRANVAAAAASARASRPLSSFFGARDRARRWRAEGGQADLVLGNNVLAQVPDLNDFVAGIKHAAGAGGRRHDRVPAPAAADRGQPVRHDLPRALLATSRCIASSGSSRTHGPHAVRRRGAADARRLAAHLRPPRRRRGEAGDRAASRAAARVERAAGLDRTGETYARLRRAGRARPSAQLLEFLIDAGAARASRSPATARRARATRC